MTEILEALNSESIGILSQEQQIELDRIQENAARNSMDFLNVRTENDPFPLVAMATGIGKGRIIHKIIEENVRRNPNYKVLVIVGTKLTLVDQTQEALGDYNLRTFSTDEEHEYSDSEELDATTDDTEEIDESSLQEKSFLYNVVDYKKREISNANVHAATIQTVQSESSRDKLNSDEYDLVIVDEAHNIGTKQRSDTIKRFKNVVGFTATPYRHTGALKAPEQYGFTVIESLTLPEAQEKELLPPLLETAIDTSHLVDEIPTTQSGQIDYKKLEKLLKDSPDLRPFIADELEKHIGGENKRKTIVAVNFVWEAEEIAKLLKEKGISVGVAVNQNAAKMIDSEEIPALDAINRYKLPKDNPKSLQVLVSPYVASEGFDAPATEAIVWASPTDSTVRYTQFTGRVARRYPGKSHGMVIDFLYQTSQFNWSYNFGQWMKDSVIKLPNGMLFQGSKKQLARLTQSPEFTQIEDTNRPEKDIPLSELQNTDLLLPIQVADVPITSSYLNTIYIGGDRKVVARAREVFEEMRDTHPELIARRKSGHGVDVVTDKDLFAQMMEEKGVQLKPKGDTDIQDTDFPISNAFISNAFVGRFTKNYPVALEVLEEIRRSNPELIVTRRNGKRNLEAVTDRNLFTNMMQERGIKIREDVDIKDTDFAISQRPLKGLFYGTYENTRSAAEEVSSEIQQIDPALVTVRKIGAHLVTVVTDRDLFIRKMQERGIKLRTQ